MSRYIEYDAIDYRNDKMHDKSSDFIDGVIYMAQRIEEAPSIDIVRCKECGRTAKRSTQYEGKKYCPVLAGWVDDDFYCGYGEVRDE